MSLFNKAWGVLAAPTAEIVHIKGYEGNVRIWEAVTSEGGLRVQLYVVAFTCQDEHDLPTLALQVPSLLGPAREFEFWKEESPAV